MVECGICLEEYQEGDLELHLEMCVVRLKFRCSICNEDYVSKEGLWNHLDLHGIADESKELRCQEIKAKYKLHQCVLCNDQRAYSESCYWKHVHDVHDGFFLRCSDCGQHFRSEKLQNDHVSSHCKAKDQTVASDFNALEEEKVPIQVENMPSAAKHLKISREEKRSNANDGLNDRLNEHSPVNLNTCNNVDSSIIDKVSELPTVNSTKSKRLPSRFACDICGLTFSFKKQLIRHKSSKYSCVNARQRKCPHCRRLFQMKEFQEHFELCKKKNFSCELCSSKFQIALQLTHHMRNVHRVFKNAKQDQNEMKNITKNASNVAGKTIKRSSNDTLVPTADSSSSSNVVEETTKKDIANPSSRSSGTQCSHCGKKCSNAFNLRRHISQCHQSNMCRICGSTFEGSSRAQYHKIMEHTKPRYECSKCSMKFHWNKNYKRHLIFCDAVQSDSSSYKSPAELIPKDRSDIDLYKEITVEETTISTRDDQGQSMVNPPCIVDASGGYNLT